LKLELEAANTKLNKLLHDLKNPIIGCIYQLNQLRKYNQGIVSQKSEALSISINNQIKFCLDMIEGCIHTYSKHIKPSSSDESIQEPQELLSVEDLSLSLECCTKR